MEASTLQAPAGLARNRIAIGFPLLRLRSDEQLVALFRAGHDEAFRVIHDRYQKRLLAYTRQMLPRGQDAEDALQDVFVRAYSGLRSSDRDLALRAWLFRVAHNRCVDELRRPAPPAPEVLQLTGRTVGDPVAEADRRESLRRLIVDVRRLPEQQRSALLMREMGGMSYAELACTLGTSVPAVKSLLVRARLGLAQAAEARDTACCDIRGELADAHYRGVRPNATAKRHMRDCAGCRSFKRELRTVNRRLAALAPLGPIVLLGKVLGLSGGAGTGATAGGAGAGAGGATAGGATAGGGMAAISGAASGGGAIASSAVVVGSGHVATLLAAAVATAGGAVAISTPPPQANHIRPAAKVQRAGPLPMQAAVASPQAADSQDVAATAVGASLLAESKAATASRAKRAKTMHNSSETTSPSPSKASTATPASPSSTGTTASPSGPASSLVSALNGGSDTSASGSSSTGSGSTTGSSGTYPQGSGTGSSSTSGSQTSGSSPSGSTTSSGSPGTTTNTTNGGTGTSSGSGTGTSPDSGSGTTSDSSGTGTSTTSK